MKISRVSIPIVNYRPLRRAKPGQVLAEDVFDRQDNLIEDVGTELTDKHLRRFKNFNVRQIAVQDTLERWIRPDRQQNLPTKTDVIDSEVLPGGLADTAERILDASTPPALRQVAEQLKEKLEGTDRNDRVRTVESIANRLEELEDDLVDLRSRIEEIDRDDVREELNAFLADPGFHLAGTILSVDATESVLRKTIKNGRRFESLRDELMEQIEQLEEGLFVESAPDDAVDEESKENFEQEELEGSFRHFRAGVLVSGLESLREAVRDDNAEAGSDLEESLSGLLSKFKTELREADELETLIEESGRDELKKVMADARENPAEVPADRLASLRERGDELAERVSDLIERQVRNREELWSALDEYTDRERMEVENEDDFLELIGRDQRADREEPTSEGDSPLGQKTREVLLLFRDNQPVRVVKVIQDQVTTDEITERLGEGNLTNLREEFEALREEIADLEDRVRDDVKSPADRSALLTILDEPAEFDPESLLDVDASGILLESIESTMTEYNRRMETLRSYLDELTADEF